MGMYQAWVIRCDHCGAMVNSDTPHKEQAQAIAQSRVNRWVNQEITEKGRLFWFCIDCQKKLKLGWWAFK